MCLTASNKSEIELHMIAVLHLNDHSIRDAMGYTKKS